MLTTDGRAGREVVRGRLSRCRAPPFEHEVRLDAVIFARNPIEAWGVG
jgi:hypothetical protein